MRAAPAILFAVCIGCSDGGESPNASGADGGVSGGGSPSAGGADDSGGSGTDTTELEAVPGVSRYALVGEQVTLDGSESSGATGYEWYFGNGEGWDEARSESAAEVVYDEPGRYQAVLTVYDDTGRKQSASVTISVTLPSTYEYGFSRSMLALPSGDTFAMVSTDANHVVLLSRDDDQFAVERRIPTCKGPRSVETWQGLLVVACPTVDQLGFYTEQGEEKAVLDLPYGSGPFGVAQGGDALYVSLRSSGKVARFEVDSEGAPQLVRTFPGIADGRALAVLPDGRVAVARLRSPDERAEIHVIDPETEALDLVTLAFDEQVASDAEIGGVPSYLAQIAVSPTGAEAFVPSLMANVAEGTYRNGRALAFDTTVRAALSKLELAEPSENFDERFQFDEQGFAEAAAFSSRGDFVFVVMPGTRTVQRLDALTGNLSGSFRDTGYAPDGAVVTSDDAFLLVNAQLSREVTVYDLRSDASTPADHIALLEEEPLAAQVLHGKQLFNDSADTRISKSGYIACAHCHLDGDSDNRTWDFTDRGEGLRNTISMLGHAGTGDGPIHWSGNFDEIQDFENDIRNAFGGTGLMDDADFHSQMRDQTLGGEKAGYSDDLDALNAYAATLTEEKRSPFRDENGALTQAAVNGKALFESEALGCTTCHSGSRLTDSVFTAPGEPLLHDVGTLTEASGKRLGGELTGIDTPTLHGLWHSAPYLHDGSAATVEEVLRERNPDDEHGHTGQLSDTELDELVAYLLSLDGNLD